MKVLLSVASLRLSYGGPAVSVAQLAQALAAAGNEVAVWAADGSAPEASHLAADSAVVRLAGDERAAMDFTLDGGVLHDNGIWLPHNHRLSMLARARRVPCIVSPRGMLEPWARRHKAAKKAIAWALYQRRDLARAARLHATSEAEVGHLNALNLGVAVTFIPNGIDLPPVRTRKARTSGGRVALFVGRIYPVKGLPMLVEAWARVRPKGWRLRIAGPDEAGHKAEVEAAVRRFGLTDAVDFSGPVEGAVKAAAYSNADLFVLPSHTESFGMAAAEAMAHGLPVLTTRGAPWRSLEENGCGWWTDISVDGIADALREATAATPADLAVMGDRARQLIVSQFAWASIAPRFEALYREASPTP